MDFQQDIQGEFPGKPGKVFDPGEVEHGGDQENGIGAGNARLVDLVGIEDEVLAQQRQPHLFADQGQIAEMAEKKVLVGQHRQAGGAVLLIDPGNGKRVEIGADDPLARRPLLHLGNDRRPSRLHRHRARARDKTARLVFQIRRAAPSVPASGVDVLAAASSPLL